MATISYPPSTRFPPHVDHCDNSLVCLTSLGLTSRFMVQAPGMSEKQVLELSSGDLLVFDASSAANILHGVEGIVEGSCPEGLCETLQKHRYGVQCRLTF
ncbi:hypothetical protein TeGR_g14031 [Tetraparma gracilis]|uniref:Alpha-ketoglutarate-dependent dioxygenase AlkB-like domain-containing protein n=1 Tax=Tetraparma gracilis TaxID=2962635 RepID=A0ABQ6N6Y0_9STRA|nr:hypothetical protein TeGR_g14031 [Tetraparma gracilis]